MGFQIITNRSSLISGNVFQTIYFLLYWFVIVAIVWRSIDFASIWYLDHYTKEDHKLPESVVPLLKRVSQIVVIFIAGTVLLGYFGVNILAISAALGLSGFAIALAAKDTITNIISGFVIMMDQPFKIGDRIYVSSVDGWADVDEIGVRSTTVKTRDNRLVEIPNSLIVDQPVINYSRPDPSYRLQTDFGIGTGMDIPKVVQILRDAVQEVDFRVRWWVASYTEKRGVSHAVNTAIQEAATKEGIDMPDTTIALDNRLRFSDDDIDKITKSFQTSPVTKSLSSPEEASGDGEED
jgi:small-conductance mechanosensitive channel